MDVRHQVSHKLRGWSHRSLEEIDHNRVEAFSQCREPSKGLLYMPLARYGDRQSRKHVQSFGAIVRECG